MDATNRWAGSRRDSHRELAAPNSVNQRFRALGTEHDELSDSLIWGAHRALRDIEGIVAKTGDVRGGINPCGDPEEQRKSQADDRCACQGADVVDA